MRLFPPTLEIGDLDGFTSENDLFGRSKLGKGLTNIISTASDSLVIAVDNEWGTGKTTFLKMWAGELRKLEVPVVFFDAFQHDYVEDAFTAIAAEIIALANAAQKQDEPATKKFVRISVRAAKILLRSGLKVGTKFASAGVLSLTDVGDAAADLAKEAGELEDKYLGELLTKSEQEKQVVQSFRDALGELPALLASPKADSPKAKPLVIIIDELDRCRPDFALQILERIKHFFSVEGVQFVLGTHLGQLRNSISAIYGSGIDSAKYLQKFITFTLHLTEREVRPQKRHSAVYIDFLTRSMLPEARFGKVVELAKPYFEHLAYRQTLSFRSIEKIVSALAISLSLREEKDAYPDAIIIGLCALKVLSPEIYVNAKSGTLVYSDARIPLGFAVAPEQRVKHELERIIRVWRWYADSSIADDNPDYRGFSDRLNWETNLERWEVVPHIANNLVDRLS